MSDVTRRRVVIPEEGAVAVVVEGVPVIQADEALVSLRVAGVCGSDLHGMHGSHPTMKPPYYPGHEVVGVVEKLGADATELGLAVGDLVTPEPPLPCAKCKMCTSGRSNICEDLQFFGCGWREGGMADVFSVPASRLHRIPEGFDLRQAALIEPLATPVHAVRLAGGVRDKAVVIIGCGTIGLLTLAAAKAQGARCVVMTDISEAKRTGALAKGADAVVDSSLPELVDEVLVRLGESADVVFDCVSIASTVSSGVQMVQRGGTVVMVGVPSKPIEVDAFLLQDRQIRLQGTATYLSDDYVDAIRIIGSGGVDALAMITAAFPLSAASEAFAAAETGAHIKVLITAEDVKLS